ncbi:DNA mismatch repair protein MutS [Limisphaera sp. VF-2]|uniref:DNA mismatch repair protein MutS n=1 Tax=Limisphaera sp. VF-2 TaxID=3400418 RepID=UPI00175A86A9|nr:DNA mismatch repair protein MutS [Limisphaera sp.]
MMAQYRRIKGELPRDALLLFRLGDFYEMFFEDAQVGARILGLALTRRNGVPMCGLPYHAASTYIGRLLRAGYKVALCDQLEEARPGKLVKREVTAILTPGTHFDERLLTQEQNNFLAAVCPGTERFGLAVVDLTTGEFRATELEDLSALLTELERLRPAEIILPQEAATLRAQLLGETPVDASAGTPSRSGTEIGAPRPTRFGWVVNPHEDWAFAPETAQFALRDHFRVATLDGFGLKGRPWATGAAGAILHYLTQHLHRDVRHLTQLSFYQRGDFLGLDTATLRHLEVLEPLHRDAPRQACLYGAINRTVTPMGARRLRDWLSQPLATLAPIHQRQQAIQAFLDHPGTLDAFRRQLAEVRDLERTLSRLSAGSGNARDLVALRLALEQFPALREQLLGLRCAPSAEAALPLGEPAPAPVVPPLLQTLAGQLVPLPELVDLIQQAIVDDPPLSVKEGGLIRDGFDPALDELRRAMREGKEWIARYQAEEIQRTGIPSLKVRYNSVFGYYIEVTRANLDRVPSHYQRKQTIANGERFITPELKDIEARILGAEERSLKLEYELFQQIRERVLAHLVPLQQAAAALAQADVLAALAETARVHQYCRPEVRDEGLIQIRDGRHPVLEQTLLDERFVPNDTWLASGPAAGRAQDAPEGPAAGAPPQIALITGPNMAGKSTYIRQVALLVLLAHTGSFVPARSARIDLVDRLFTRIGASDDLTRGQSTFMVEMTETANILRHATARSLIVLDEVGRGTSTFDGLSLAWSIVEYIHNQIGAKTLFATHYHELTELAARLPRLKNYNVAVREWRDQIVFLHKIVEGATDKSYGIHVARLAGVPQPVLERAKVILANLEEAELNPDGTPKTMSRRQRDREKLRQLAPFTQLDLFG